MLPSEIGMAAIIGAAVEKAGDELCSFPALMHRNLTARACALLPPRPCFPRMASWLVRALLRGGRCRGLGWTAGVRYRRSGGSAVVAGNTAAGSADVAARPQNRVAGPDERFGGDPRQRRRFSRELSLAPAADDPSAEPSGRMAQTRSLHAGCAVASFPDPSPQESDLPYEARGAACRLQRRQGGGFGR